MAFTASYLHSHSISLHPIRSTLTNIPKPQQAAPRPPSAGRRECLLFTATTMLTAVNLPSADAKDIPLFGIRKKLEKVEEKTEELVKEGFEAVESGIEKVETGIESVESGIGKAEKGVVVAAENVSFGGLAQAGVVAAAEVFGVLIATSIVNGILRPQPQKS